MKLRFQKQAETDPINKEEIKQKAEVLNHKLKECFTLAKEIDQRWPYKPDRHYKTREDLVSNIQKAITTSKIFM